MESETAIIADSQKDMINENINELAEDMDIDVASMPLSQAPLLEEEADSLRMPPPIELRRSARISEKITKLADEQEKAKIWKFTPVTDKCCDSHLGLGCAAKSAGHMPHYYDSLKPVY